MSIITEEERPLELYLQKTGSVRDTNVIDALERAEDYTVDKFHNFNLNELKMDENLKISNGIGPMKMTEEAFKKVLSLARIPYGYAKNVDNELISHNFNDNITSVKDREMVMCLKNINGQDVVASFCNIADVNRFESNRQIISRFQNDPNFNGNIFDVHQSLSGIKLTILSPIEHEIFNSDSFKFGLDFNYSPTGQFQGYINPSILRSICTNGARVTYGSHKFFLSMKANETLNDVYDNIYRNFSYSNDKFIELIKKSAETNIHYENMKNVISSLDRVTGNKELTNSVINIDEDSRDNIVEKAYEIAKNEDYEGKTTYNRKVYDVYNDVTAYARDLNDFYNRSRLQSESFEMLLSRN